MRVALLFVGVVLGGCAAPRPAPPHVTLEVRSVRDEDTGVETSEWHVEARAPASRVWLHRSDGALLELARERGQFRAGRRSIGEGWLDGRGVLLVVAGATGDEAVADAVLARDEGLDDDESGLVSTPVELPLPPSRPALEGLHAGPRGPEVRWSVRVADGVRTWFDLVVRDALTGGTVFRSMCAGCPAAGTSTQDEPLPAGLLKPDRSYVVEVRARSELGLVAVERATRRTLRLP